MTKVINLTPHSISIYSEEDAARYENEVGHTTFLPIPHTIIPPSGTIARARTEEEQVGELDGVPVYRMRYTDPIDLPDYEPGIVYIVSALTAQAAARAGRDTRDLYMVAHPVRDAAGNVIGCTALSQL